MNRRSISGLIQVSGLVVRAAAQAAMVRGKSASAVTWNFSARRVLSRLRGRWKLSSGRTPRASGSSQCSARRVRDSAIGNRPRR